MKVIQKDTKIYKEWKKITDAMYSGDLKEGVAMKRLIQLLKKYKAGTRSRENELLGTSYFVYDKDRYAHPAKEKPLGLGLIYKKPDYTKTQDIVIVCPDGTLYRFYSEKKMVKLFPAMKNVHKTNLPI
jgi:hypothetical protein